MNQSRPLELVAAGSLIRPGIIGRLVRLSLAVLCLQALWRLLNEHAALIATPVNLLPEFALLMLAPLCIFNYVVNIGFSKNWGRWPLWVSLGGIGTLATLSFAASGSLDGPLLGAPLLLWLVYFYAHLGISFLLAALIATPGCEMRSIPELFGRIIGRDAAGHHCPVAILGKIDAWEQKKFGGR